MLIAPVKAKAELAVTVEPADVLKLAALIEVLLIIRLALLLSETALAPVMEPGPIILKLIPELSDMLPDTISMYDGKKVSVVEPVIVSERQAEFIFTVGAIVVVGIITSSPATGAMAGNQLS